MKLILSGKVQNIVDHKLEEEDDKVARTCQKYSNEIKILTSGNLAEAGEEGRSPGLLVLRSPGLFTHITKLTFQL